MVCCLDLTLPKAAPCSAQSPCACGTRWKLTTRHDRHGQAIDDAGDVLGHIQHAQAGTADEIANEHQVAAPSIEAALRGQTREQGTMLAPQARQLGFHVGAAALADERQGDQLTSAARRGGRTGLVQVRLQLLPDVIHDGLNPQAESVEIGYHHGVLPDDGDCAHPSISTAEDGVVMVELGSVRKPGRLPGYV